MLRSLIVALAVSSVLAQNVTTEVKDLINQTAAELTGVKMNSPGDLKAFISALILNTIMVVACLVGFTFLRISFPLMYSHNIDKSKESLAAHSEEVDSSSTGGGRFRELKSKIVDWVGDSFRTSTEEAVDRAGLDATLLREFCLLGGSILAVIGIPMCLIMVPINSTLGEVDPGEDHLSKAEMAMIRDDHPWLYYVHAVLVWLVCFAVHFFVNRAQARFLRLRVRWLTSLPAPRSTTVLVQNIPCEWRSDARLKEFFGKIFSPQDVVSAHVVRRQEDLAKLVTKRENLLAMKRKAELTYEKTEKVETFRTGYCCGPKVETLQYCEDNLEGLDEEIRSLRQSYEEAEEQDPCANASHCGFVTFRSRRVAEMAQDLQISANKKEWNVTAAPEARDIRWNDLRKNRQVAKGAECVGFACVVGLYIGFAPIVVFITNLAELIHMGPLQPLWEGFAPTIGLTIFLSLLPTVLMIIFRTFFSLKADAFSQHKLQAWYFLFQMVFVVLVTTVGKSVVSRFRALLEDPTSATEIMASSLPNATHFYMTYLVLQWTRHAMEMLRYVPLSKFLLFKTIFTQEEAKEMAEPEDQDCYGFGARNVNLAVNFVLGLLFCSISPLVTIMAMLDLFLARVTYGYLTIFAETKKPDLGGVFWATQIGYIQLALALYCIFMVGVIQQKSSSNAYAVAAPSLLFVLWSWWHVRAAYQWKKLPFQEVAFNCEDHFDQKDSEDVTGQCYIQPELAALDAAYTA